MLIKTISPYIQDNTGVLPVEDNTPVCFSIEGFTQGKSWHLWNNHSINLHDVMEFVLTHTGRADITMCSWSISTPAMKVFAKMKEKGLVNTCYAVVDIRTRKDHHEAFAMALEMFSKVKIYPCHAKVIVIENKDWKVTIAGSANLTNNPKSERLFISTLAAVAELDRAKIMEMFERGTDV